MIATADLVDLGTATPCELQRRSYGRREAFAGEIVTVCCFEDNGLIKEAIAQPGAGRVLVVDGAASMRRALVGDKVVGAATESGWEGLVIHGAVRDVVGLRGLDIGLFALGSIPRRPLHDGSGVAGPPVSFGGVTFVPGQFLAADPDGVVVSRDALPEMATPEV